MTDEESDPRPWDSLVELASRGDTTELGRFIEGLSSGEAARAISRLDAQERARVLTALGPQRAAELIEECPPVQATEFIGQLPPETAAAIIQAMPSDEQADLITTLDQAEAEAILQEMEPEEAAEARKLASYEPDEAGGLMITEFLSFPENLAAGDVLDDLRRNAEKYSDYDVQYVYCTSPFGHLVGVLRLRDLLLTPKHRPLSDFMIRKPLSVRAHTSLDELDELFERHGYFGMPVVDDEGRLLGVVRRADVEAAQRDKAGSDYLKTQGIVGGEELRTMPLAGRVGRRLPWLAGNIVLNVMAASVIAFYQDTLAAAIALAVFLPIISDMSGNAGIQAIAVSLREMTLGQLKTREVVWVALKESSLGVINGLALGVLLAIVALLWKGNMWLGLVVGAALAINTVVAAVVGGSLPLILRQLKKDPALASGPILTTVTDMCGFFLVLSFASAVLPRISQ